MAASIIKFNGLKRSATGLAGYNRCSKGFTLAELLIALAVLGVIATFTIPKVLQSQQDARYNAIAKEAAATVVSALQTAKSKGTANAYTTMGGLTPYMNYINIDTSGVTQVDIHLTTSDYTCGVEVICVRSHNGSMLFFPPSLSFGGTGSTNAIYFWVDADGQLTPNSQSASLAPVFWVYWNEKLRTWGTAEPNTAYYDNNSSSVYTANPMPSYDPPWLKW